MANEVKAYLPGYDVVTVFHLRDLAARRRKIIKCENIKVLQVPFFEGLSIKEMLEFAEQFENGRTLIALPEPKKEIEKLPRAYIANILYTEIGDPFEAWVKNRVEIRNAKVTQLKDLAIKMDPEIAAIYQRSTAVSCKKHFIIS